MKKVKVWLSVMIMLGIASVASAQFDARGMQKFNEGADHRAQQVERKTAQAQRGASFVNEILKNGSKTPISYTIVTGRIRGVSGADRALIGSPHTGTIETPGTDIISSTAYSKNGKVKGWEYKKGGKIYILLNRADWEDMYDECMPSKTTRFARGAMLGIYIAQQTIHTNTGNHVDTRDDLLNHKHYEVNGKKYTVITFPAK